MTAASAVAVALPAGAIVTLLLVQGLVRGPNLDAAVFLQIAEQMRDGATPYRDLFDHKPPGIYLVEALVGTVAPLVNEWTRAWGITLVAALGTLVLLAGRIAPIRGWATSFALIAVSPLLGAFAFAQSGGYTESLAILPATAGFLLASSMGGQSARRSFAAGALLGSAVATSFHLAPAALAGLVAQFATGAPRRRIVAFVAGGILVSLAIAAWLVGAGALPQAIVQLVAYNRAYVEGQTLVQPAVLGAIAAMAIMVGPALAGTVIRLVELAMSRRAAPDELGAAVWFLGAVVFVVVQGRYFGHYVVPLAAPMAILSGPVLVRLIEAGRSATRRERWAALGIAGLSLILPILYVVRFEPSTERRQPTADAAAAVAARTLPGDRIVIWGNDAAVYLYADRAPAGPYLFLFPLMLPSFTTASMVMDLLATWEAEPPAAIIDASAHPSGPSAVPLLGPRRPGLPAKDLLDPLRAFVREGYSAVETVDGWTIYVPG